MNQYKVVWTIDLDADNPTEAAKLALEIHRNPESTATVFQVIDSSNIEHEVDLSN